MKCPDCGTNLSSVELGREKAERCFKCGGFWIDMGTVHKVDSKALSSWNRISADPRWLADGSGLCPLDKTKLVNFSGENVPPDLVVRKCTRCGRMWFAGDSLFDYKPAVEA